ncbi:hypothetical protein BDZ91DRAFT_786754 [Kalaharituber pfeilii]|nr:hypothetical protein BDZ91DRAFT_786754 [Kalaharituber pfeilii]
MSSKWFCEVCQKWFSLRGRSGHIAGRKHQRKLKYHCEICDRTISVAGRLSHEVGSKHRTELSKLNRKELGRQELLRQELERQELERKTEKAKKHRRMPESESKPKAELERGAWTCDICNRSMSNRNREEHLQGGTHARALARRMQIQLQEQGVIAKSHAQAAINTASATRKGTPLKVARKTVAIFSPVRKEYVIGRRHVYNYAVGMRSLYPSAPERLRPRKPREDKWKGPLPPPTYEPCTICPDRSGHGRVCAIRAGSKGPRPKSDFYNYREMFETKLVIGTTYSSMRRSLLEKWNTQMWNPRFPRRVPPIGKPPQKAKGEKGRKLQGKWQGKRPQAYKCVERVIADRPVFPSGFKCFYALPGLCYYHVCGGGKKVLRAWSKLVGKKKCSRASTLHEGMGEVAAFVAMGEVWVWGGKRPVGGLAEGEGGVGTAMEG